MKKRPDESLMVKNGESYHLRHKRRGVKGSDIYLMAMYAGWIAYIMFAAFTFYKTGAWFPVEMTIGTVLLFLYETFALYRLAKAKEGEKDERGILSKAHETVKGWVSPRIGIDCVPDLEDEIKEACNNE